MLNWKNIIKYEKNNIYYKKLKYIINKKYLKKKIIYPKKNNIFEVFKITKFKNIKVVILGQDPYCNKNQAHGLAFSLLPNIELTPSIINIYKEIKRQYINFKIPKNGYLINWSKQGVFLLNSILTVEHKKPLSHKNIGWEIFTNRIIKYINKYLNKIVFLLWGKYAQKKIKYINKKKHLILKSSHPSPLSYNKGFKNCNHFLKTNIFLIKNNIKPILW